MSHELPSGSVTLLFTDIEGSTRLLNELGAEAYKEVLADHRRLWAVGSRLRTRERVPRGCSGVTDWAADE